MRRVHSEGASPRSRRLSFPAGLSAVAICALAVLSTLPLWQGCIMSCRFETTQWRYDLPNGYRIHGNIYYDGHYGAALVRPDGETALMAVIPFDVRAFCSDGRYIGLRHKRTSAWVRESYFLLDSVSGEWTLKSASQEEYAAACARAGAQMGAWVSTRARPEGAVAQRLAVYGSATGSDVAMVLGDLGEMLFEYEDALMVRAYCETLLRLRLSDESHEILAARMVEAEGWDPLPMPEETAQAAFSRELFSRPCLCFSEPCYIPRVENGYWYAQKGGTDAQPRFRNLYVYDADAHILYWYEED